MKYTLTLELNGFLKLLWTLFTIGIYVSGVFALIYWCSSIFGAAPVIVEATHLMADLTACTTGVLAMAVLAFPKSSKLESCLR